MQVIRIQNGNYYRTNFCANLKIEGDTKDISEDTIKNWGNELNSVGTDNDNVTLIFSAPETKQKSIWAVGDIQEWNESGRDIIAKCCFNGTEQVKHIGYSKVENGNHSVLTKKNVDEFINSLKAKDSDK